MTDYSQPKILLSDAATFIETLERETGVSRRFLEDARPIIERAFSDVSPDRLPDCLKTIRYTVQMQAETEICLRRSMEDAKRLMAAEAALNEKLHNLKKDALAAKEKVAVATAGLFRWQNPSLDTN